MKVTLTFTDCTVDEASGLMGHVAGRQVDQTADVDDYLSLTPEPPSPDDGSTDPEEEDIRSAPRKRASRAKVAVPVPPPPPSALVPPCTPSPALPPAAPVPPPPPPQNFNAAELVETFPQFMLHITPRLASGELTTARLKLVTDALGIEGLGSLATQTNLIGRAVELLK